MSANLTVDEIESFVSIAELGGFTEASRKLNRSQPAISRRSFTSSSRHSRHLCSTESVGESR